MPPTGSAILIGAGPTSGGGIARYLASPKGGNLAVAIMARNKDNLEKLASDIRSKEPGSIVHPIPSDTSSASLQSAFEKFSSHADFKDLKLKLAIYHVKHSSKEPFLDTTPESYAESLNTYSVGAFTFAQLATKLSYAQYGGQTSLAETNGQKKATIILTGTLGALRTNVGYAAYGSTRAAARSIAQAVAKEHSAYGIHCVHAIANGSIRDEDTQETRTGVRMSAKSVADTYLWLANQSPSLWVHEVSAEVPE